MSGTRSRPQATRPRLNVEALVGRVARNPALLPEVFGGLESAEANIRYGSLKALRLLGETRPDLLYPSFQQIAGLLDSANNLFQWAALRILADLAKVDSSNQLDGWLDQYFRPMGGPNLITAANAIMGAVQIARAKPQWMDRIVRELLQVEDGNYQTPECRQVALSHVLKALQSLYAGRPAPENVLTFATRQQSNRRSAVKAKATTFLRKQQALRSHPACAATQPPGPGRRRTPGSRPSR
ncbi:MAG: hypothetical protein RJA22_2482 [Verrucomicrobiota bacterium]|jgi:hypothetical protein